MQQIYSVLAVNLQYDLTKRRKGKKITEWLPNIKIYQGNHIIP